MKYFSIIILNLLLASSVYAAGTFYSTPHATNGKLFFDSSVQVQQDTDITSNPGLSLDAPTTNISAEKIDIPTTSGNITFDRGLIIKNIGIQQNASLNGFTIDNLTQNSESIIFRNKMGSNFVDFELGSKIFKLDTSYNQAIKTPEDPEIPLLKFVNDPNAPTNSQLTIDSQRTFDNSTTESFTISNTLKIGGTTISNDAGKLKFDTDINVLDLKLTTPSLGTLGVASTLGNQVVTREWVHKRNYLTTGLLDALKAGLDLSKVTSQDTNIFFRASDWNAGLVSGTNILTGIPFNGRIVENQVGGAIRFSVSPPNYPMLPPESHFHKVGTVIRAKYRQTLQGECDDAQSGGREGIYNYLINTSGAVVAGTHSFPILNGDVCTVNISCPSHYAIFATVQRHWPDVADGDSSTDQDNYLNHLEKYSVIEGEEEYLEWRRNEAGTTSFNATDSTGDDGFAFDVLCIPLSNEVIDNTI